MNIKELNKYILHYIQHDKTNRAIMLTAPWGTGKSYYIKGELLTFLSNNGYSCIVISLYGISNLPEISKAIFIEAMWKGIKKRVPDSLKQPLESVKESKSTTKGLLQTGVKSIIKGVTSYFSVDLSQDEQTLSKLYESVDLSNSLIILEDLERSGLSVLDVLGYVNNLTEQDGVKILLIANEDELLSYELSPPDKDGKQRRILDKESYHYLKIKEKTIGDTIYYHCDFHNAIKEIIRSFDNATLSRFNTEKHIKDILDIMFIKDNYNLRTFIFACQKTVDVFSLANKDEESFNQTVFYSIITFSMEIKNGIIPDWEGTALVSQNFGLPSFPLYRFCYNYIRWQKFNSEEVEEAINAHKKLILFDSSGSRNDTDLEIIYEYLTHTEGEVIAALHRIESRLSDPESIPIYSYRKLMYHLVILHTILNYDYTHCQEKMLQNISLFSQELDEQLLTIPISDFETEEEKTLFQEFMNKVRGAILSQTTSDQFSYSPEDLAKLHREIETKKEYYTRNHTFIYNFNVDKLVEMLVKCTPAQLQEFRSIMFLVYRNAFKHEYLNEDLQAMQRLKNLINARIIDDCGGFDKIVLQQLRWLMSNIDEFIEKIS